MAIEILRFLIYPGITFVVILSVVFAWLLRFFIARMENRIGPPFGQPAYDVLKLMAKERLYPDKANKWILHSLPRIQLMVALLIALFVPISSKEGLLSFDGDIYFVIFLLAIHGATVFLVGWASKNPYSLSGAGRAVLTEISFEIPLSISLAGMAVMTGSMKISTMTSRVSELLYPFSPKFEIFNLFYLVPWLILFITMSYCTIAVLELNPFSAAHAETEIVGGWHTELTGSDLGLAKFADMLNLFNLSGIIVALFLGGPIIISSSAGLMMSIIVNVVTIISFILKIILVILILALISTLSSRLRIDQITGVLWRIFLPLSLLSILLVLVIQQTGG